MNTDDSKQNPFSAPVADVAESAGLARDESQITLGQIAKRVFLDWEKMRVLYIGILVLATLLLGWPHLKTFEFWGTAIFGGLIANACYFIGPIIETYVTWLGFRGLWLRWACFITGTLFTIAGVAAAMFSMSLPNQ